MNVCLPGKKKNQNNGWKLTNLQRIWNKHQQQQQESAPFNLQTNNIVLLVDLGIILSAGINIWKLGNVQNFWSHPTGRINIATLDIYTRLSQILVLMTVRQLTDWLFNRFELVTHFNSSQRIPELLPNYSYSIGGETDSDDLNRILDQV